MEDVKIVGLHAPKKNRRYEPGALKEAARLYEGVKVNLNHQPKGDTEPRRLEDRIGLLEGVYWEKGDEETSTEDEPVEITAPGAIRTHDLRFRKPLLYPLSYGGHSISRPRDRGRLHPVYTSTAKTSS